MYHIHISYLCNDRMEQQEWQINGWARIFANNIDEAIKVSQEMWSKTDDEMKKDRYTRDPQLIIALIIKNDYGTYEKSNSKITVNQLYIGHPNVSKNDMCFDNKNLTLDSDLLFNGYCYRDDIIEDV